MTSIGSNSALFDNHDDILNRLVYFRRAAYFNRMQALMGMVDNIDKHGRTNFTIMISVVRAEGLVYRNYLESTGLFNLIEPGDKVKF
uniref:Uncharacterized protein n=1 Tax=Acrobeloides nanus TaxID=290746 RepID=A0A914E9B0_9BILA